jgi:aromatic ring-opening dioxygenase catalytic subunit (LigB family)
MQVRKYVLAPLRDDDVLILGSGLSFHNMAKLMSPTKQSNVAATEFNDWLKETVLHPDGNVRLDRLLKWEGAPSARIAHPREEHFMPLLMVAAAAGPTAKPELIQDGVGFQGNHAVSAYMFH